jgi:hypothetical protein
MNGEVYAVLVSMIIGSSTILVILHLCKTFI